MSALRRFITMDVNLQKLLDELPDKPSRSRLEPYREFIEDLREQGADVSEYRQDTRGKMWCEGDRQGSPRFRAQPTATKGGPGAD